LGLVLGGCETSHPGATALKPAAADGPARAQKPEESPSRPPRLTPLAEMEPERSIDGVKISRAASIRAVVNGEAILDEEVKAASYQALLGAQSLTEQTEILNQALNQLIDREVVLQDAIAKLTRGPGGKFLDKLKDAAHKEFEQQWLRRMMKGNNIKSEEEFKNFLRAHQMSLEMIRRQWERNFMTMEYARHLIEPHLARIGHTQIVEYYEKHPEQFQVPETIKWQDLFVAAGQHPSRDAARQFAETLAARARQGEDFVRLVNVFDNGDSRFRNGAGIGSKRGEIKPPEAEPVLFGLPDGGVALVELPTGYHIVRVVKRQEAGPVPFDEKTQKRIKDKLRGEVFDREMKRIVNDLKRKAVIEIVN
jgi:parvulin-like peptidyl-prolyl isomerase